MAEPRDAEPDSAAITVVIADDHPVVRRGLRSLLDTLPGVRVIGEAGDGQAAVREVQLARPDVVLMDIRMPVLDGVAATRQILDAVPGTAVLILTMYDDDATVLTAMRAGARGYLLKEADQEDILGAIRAVAAGQAVFGASIAARMLDLFAAPAAPTPDGPHRQHGAAAAELGLTARELDILRLLASGRRTAQIAGELYLSPKTVSNHLTSIFAKLQVTDRVSAVVRARERGIGGSAAGRT